MYGHDLLVGQSMVEKDVRGIEDDVRRGREAMAWRSFAFGDLFSDGGEALSLEERDANGKWQPAGQTGTVGRELATYGVLSYADATVARFGGTHLWLHTECAGPVEWLKCKSGGGRPCVGCRTISVVPVAVNENYGGMGLMWGRRRPTCQDPCPPSPPNPAEARLEELQSHVTVWQPSGESLANTPSLHRTLASCMRTHYPNGSPAGKSTRVKP
jgi:hypothetical protein